MWQEKYWRLSGSDDNNDDRDDDKDDDKDDDNKDSRKSISRRRGKDIDLDDDDDDGDDNDNNEDVEGKKSNSEKKRNAKKAVMTGPTPVALHTSPDFVIPDSKYLQFHGRSLTFVSIKRDYPCGPEPM